MSVKGVPVQGFMISMSVHERSGEGYGTDRIIAQKPYLDLGGREDDPRPVVVPGYLFQPDRLFADAVAASPVRSAYQSRDSGRARFANQAWQDLCHPRRTRLGLIEATA